MNSKLSEIQKEVLEEFNVEDSWSKDSQWFAVIDGNEFKFSYKNKTEDKPESWTVYSQDIVWSSYPNIEDVLNLMKTVVKS